MTAILTATAKMRAMLSRPSLPFRPVVLRDPCVYCVVWPMPQRQSDAVTLEHIQPKSDGGANSWRNYASAHAACNGNRSSMPLLRFFLYRQQVAGLHGKANRKRRLALKRRLLQGVHAS